MSKNILVRDTTIKILSLVFAIFLWFYVITEQNPVVPKEITIPIRIVNVENLNNNNLVMLNDPNSFTVTLRLKGKKEVLDAVNASNINAFADISGYKTAGDIDVPVVISGLPEGVSITSKPYQTVRVTLDKKIVAQRPVTFKITGNPVAGLAYMMPSLAPTEVVLTGAESLISKVAEARVDIDIAGAGSNVEEKLPIRLLDAAGKDISGVQTDIQWINVTVPIANTKRVPIQLVTEGSVADGYAIASAAVEPKEILVTGTQQALDSLTVINTGVVNVSNLNADTVMPVILSLPEGIQLVNTNEGAKATLDIQKVVTQTIAVNNIEYRNLSPRYRIEGNLDKNISVTVRGPEDLLNQAGQSFGLYVDLRNAREGVDSYEILWDKASIFDILEVSPQQISIDIRKNG